MIRNYSLKLYSNGDILMQVQLHWTRLDSFCRYMLTYSHLSHADASAIVDFELELEISIIQKSRTS